MRTADTILGLRVLDIDLVVVMSIITVSLIMALSCSIRHCLGIDNISLSAHMECSKVGKMMALSSTMTISPRMTMGTTEGLG